MLAKDNRLKREELNQVFKQSKRERTKSFFLLFDFSPTTGGEVGLENPPKIAVIVSKKVAKTSVLRHQIKRKISNLLREKIIERLPHNLRAALHPQPGFEKIKSGELCAELENLFKPFFKK